MGSVSLACRGIAGLPMRSSPTRTDVAWLISGCLLAPVVVLALLFSVDRPVPIQDHYRVGIVDYAMSHAAEPPGSNARWRALDKPMYDLPNEPFFSAWVRTEISERVASIPVAALYVPAPLANLEVWINNTKRYSGGPMTRPLPFYTAPLLIPLGDLTPANGEVWLHVRIAGMGDVLGPVSALTSARKKSCRRLILRSE